MSITRRSLGRGIAAAVAATSVSGGPAAAQAPPARRIARLAFLSSASTEDRSAYHAFRKALRDAGWIEGQTLELTFHFGAGAGQARLEPLARAIADSKVDAVLGDGRVATLAMAAASKTIPIVSVLGVDPVAFGLARSWARPELNVTGVSVLSDTLNTKRLEILREIAPAARRIGVVYGSGGLPPIEMALRTGTTLGLHMQSIEIQSLDELQARLAGPDVAQVDAFLVGTDGFLDAVPARIVQPLNRLRRPAIFPDRPYVQLGGLASYGVSYDVVFVRLAGMINRILRGEQPATMPFERPERFDLTLNQRTARDAGLVFPPLVLAQAQEIID